MADRSDLIIAALQQRMGELVVNYETQIAVLRADLTELINKQEAQYEYSKSIDAKLEEV
jgi:hypothetical protein